MLAEDVDKHILDAAGEHETDEERMHYIRHCAMFTRFDGAPHIVADIEGHRCLWFGDGFYPIYQLPGDLQ